MSVIDAIGALVGDYAVYGEHADRIEGLVETQASAFVARRSNWLVLPWRPSNAAAGFYLFSEDREGQRRGREVLNGFLGPSVAQLVTMPDLLVEAALDPVWIPTGLVKASFIQRRPDIDRAEMLLRLEDLVATMADRPTVIDEVQPTHVDLLRDVRLAMLSNDSANAQRLLDQLVLTGELSAENLRFLTIELLAAFGRWQEMADLPYINVLMRARRPRAVSESILRMIWWTAIVPNLGTDSIPSVFASAGVLTNYGEILRTIQVPKSPQTRVLAFLTAIADDDVERQAAILDAAADGAERANLVALSSGTEASPVAAAPAPQTEPEPELDLEEVPILVAVGRGKFAAAVDLFLENPVPDFAGVAVDAILEINQHDRASDVLKLVQAWIAGGEIDPTRTLRRDLEDLDALVAGACAGWSDWAKRVGSDDRWADASSVLRSQHQDWDHLGSLLANQVSAVADGILEAVGSTNEDQLRASLDILCRVAAEVVENPSCAPFYETVLEVLADQENLSAQVRDAYLRLFEAILGAGPSKQAYDELLTRTTALWNLVRARQHVDWALELLDAVAGASAPDAESRVAFGMPVMHYLRALENLGLRQRVEIEALAVEFGLPPLPVQVAANGEEESVWRRLDGTIVGLYSLLSHAVPRFTSRLKQLCSPGEIVGNTDTTATSALTSLAERADHLVVDTWHAAHQATNAIDNVRAKAEQVLPQQRGVTGFLRALEARLES